MSAGFSIRLNFLDVDLYSSSEGHDSGSRTTIWAFREAVYPGCLFRPGQRIPTLPLPPAISYRLYRLGPTAASLARASYFCLAPHPDQKAPTQINVHWQLHQWAIVATIGLGLAVPISSSHTQTSCSLHLTAFLTRTRTPENFNSAHNPTSRYPHEYFEISQTNLKLPQANPATHFASQIQPRTSCAFAIFHVDHSPVFYQRHKITSATIDTFGTRPLNQSRWVRLFLSLSSRRCVCCRACWLGLCTPVL